MNRADPLAALRDIHVPDPPGFWPPAPGWIAAACVVIAAGVAAAVIVARWWRAGRVRREALASLRSLRARHQAGAPATEVATELSTLVRRFALARRPREEVAGLTGERWIAWLESALLDTGPGLRSEPWFKLEFGPRFGPRFRIGTSARAALLDAPYARECHFDAAHALDACEHWIQRA